MATDDDTRATTRWAPTIVDAGPHRMPVLTRPDPAVALPERPPERQTAKTRIEPLTRPDFERAINRLLRAIYMSAALFAASVAFTAWLLRLLR